jgi:hypothetical protein
MNVKVGGVMNTFLPASLHRALDKYYKRVMLPNKQDLRSEPLLLRKGRCISNPGDAYITKDS